MVEIAIWLLCGAGLTLLAIFFPRAWPYTLTPLLIGYTLVYWIVLAPLIRLGPLLLR